MMQDSQVHAVAEAVKSSPAVIVSGGLVLGMPIDDWIKVLTLIYIVLQLVLLIPKYNDWYQALKSKWSTRCQSKQDSSKSE